MQKMQLHQFFRENSVLIVVFQRFCGKFRPLEIKNTPFFLKKTEKETQEKEISPYIPLL